MTPEEIQARILYRDALIFVVDKPAGLPVHKGRGNAPHFEQYFEHLRFGLPKAPFLAHRLDKETSGCLILGRNTHALQHLARLFQAGTIAKTYWAVVEGTPPDEAGAIDLPLAPLSDKSYHWRMKTDPAGKPALTHYRVRGRSATHTWVELSPKTGRTHQLRVHCAAIGCPIKGDYAYGTGEGGNLFLHAQAVEIPLYPKKSPLKVTAPLPAHMEALFTQETWSVSDHVAF